MRAGRHAGRQPPRPSAHLLIPHPLQRSQLAPQLRNLLLAVRQSLLQVGGLLLGELQLCLEAGLLLRALRQLPKEGGERVSRAALLRPALGLAALGRSGLTRSSSSRWLAWQEVACSLSWRAMLAAVARAWLLCCSRSCTVCSSVCSWARAASCRSSCRREQRRSQWSALQQGPPRMPLRGMGLTSAACCCSCI